MTEIIRPGNASGVDGSTYGWDVSTVANINEAVTQPSAGNGTYVNSDTGDDNDPQVWNQFTHANGSGLSELYSSVTSVKVWAYAKDLGGQDEDLTNSIWISGGWSSETTWLTTSSWEWYFTEYTGTWSPTDIDDIQVKLKVAGNPEIAVDVLYIELDGVAGTTTTTTTIAPVVIPEGSDCDGCDCGENDCPQASGACCYWETDTVYANYDAIQEVQSIYIDGGERIIRGGMTTDGQVIMGATRSGVHVFESTNGAGTGWSQIGQPIYLASEKNISSAIVNMSDVYGVGYSGLRVMLGRSDELEIHEYDGSEWQTQLSNTGITISSAWLAGSGSVYVTNRLSGSVGTTRVYKEGVGVWNQVGTGIGWGILSQAPRLTYTGSGVLLSDHYHTDVHFHKGTARVYDWNGSDWISRGDLAGSYPEQHTGRTFEMNPEGDVVITAGTPNSSSYNNRALLWVWNGSAWNGGERIYGGAGGGYSIPLDKSQIYSSASNFIAGGQPHAVNILNYDGSPYTQSVSGLANLGYSTQIFANTSGTRITRPIGPSNSVSGHLEISQISEISGVRSSGRACLELLGERECLTNHENSYWIPSGTCLDCCGDCVDPPTTRPPTTTTRTTTSTTTTTTTTTPDPTLGACCYLGDVANTYFCQDLSESACEALNDLPDVFTGSTIWTENASCDDPQSPCPVVTDYCCDWNGSGSFFGSGDGGCTINFNDIPFSKVGERTWSYSNQTDCGDILSATVVCNNGPEALRPNGNVNTLWDVYDYTNIDDSVREPESLADGSFCNANDSDEEVEQIWSFTNPVTSFGVTSVFVNVRHRDDGITSNPQAFVNVKVGGVWQSGQGIDYHSSWGWSGVRFNGNWSSSDFDDFQVGLTAPDSIGHGREYKVANIYAELTGPPAATNEWELRSFSYPCADDVAVIGTVAPGSCSEPPTWEFEWSDSSDCACCGQLCLCPNSGPTTHVTVGADWTTYTSGCSFGAHTDVHEVLNDYCEEGGLDAESDWASIVKDGSSSSASFGLSSPPNTFTSASLATVYMKARARVASGASGVMKVPFQINGISNRQSTYWTEVNGTTCTAAWQTQSFTVDLTHASGNNTLAGWQNARFFMYADETDKNEPFDIAWFYVCLQE